MPHPHAHRDLISAQTAGEKCREGGESKQTSRRRGEFCPLQRFAH